VSENLAKPNKGGTTILTRLITIVVSAPIIILCTYLGGVYFLLLVLTLAIFSINEFYSLMRLKGFDPAVIIGNLITAFFIIFAFYALKKNWEPAHSVILTGAVMATLGSAVFLKRPKNVIVDIAVTILGMIYVGWFLSYLLFIRNLTEHGAYIFFLIITIWAEDIMAYLVGSALGKTKLVPAISPKKTVEGAIAGLVTCVIAALIFSQFIGMDLIHALILGLLIGIMAPISDLVESLVKRDVGAKDSGNVVPGHGGVLDRMDSFILTAPVLYYYVVWVLSR
jgi:phosphatidate cytidylyltransferase